MQAVEEKAQLPAEGRDPASDEEIARRLQQQLNGEAAAAARRRTRKQPTFYSPQQAGGYSGYHGVEHSMADGEAREPEDGETAEAMKAEHTGRRPEAVEGQAGPSSPSKRAQPDPSSPREVKKEEEDGAGPSKGSNSLSGRELRALMRSNQGPDASLQEHKAGSTKGSSGRGFDSGAGSGSGGDGEAGTEEVGTPRAGARAPKGKRKRSNLGQLQVKEELGLKSRDSGMSSMDGESGSDAEDQSHEEPGEAGQKKWARKIPKLPMVRHGKKWYRARLLRDSGQRVHIEFTGFEEVSGSIALTRDSDRIWRGSYKGKDWRYLGDGAWEPKERATAKKITTRTSNPRTSSRPTSSNAHAQQSSDAPSSAGDGRPVNEPDPNGREAQSPRMKEPLEAAASQPEQQRKPPLKRAAAEKADKPSKKGSLKPLDTDDDPLLATSPANGQALSAGAVKPETPAKGMETKPAPGDAGTDSGTDDDAKASNAAERGLRNHRKRKAPDAHKPKEAAAQDAPEALEPISTHKRPNRGMPEPAGLDVKAAVAAAAAVKEAAEEAATDEAAAMLASMASEEHGDETGLGLQCEEALPAEDPAGKGVANSLGVPSPQVRGAEHHLGWKFGWKKSQKKQTDGGSSDSGEKPSARMPEPTMSPKSLRPARRTRKPLKIDNPYDDANRQIMMPAPEPSAQQAPLQSPFATPPDSEDEKEPEVRAPSSGRGRGGRRGGRAAHRGGRGRGGGRWAHHRAALAAAALANGSAAEDTSGGEGLHDAGSGVQPALAQRPVRTLKPSSKILAANHSNHSPSPPPTRRGRSASAGPHLAPQAASRGLIAFSGLMDAMSALDGPRTSGGRLPPISTHTWEPRAAPTAAQQALPIAAWPGNGLGGGAPLFGGLDARWHFTAHRKILEASEKLMPAQQPASPSILAESIANPQPPPVPLFQ